MPRTASAVAAQSVSPGRFARRELLAITRRLGDTRQELRRHGAWSCSRCWDGAYQTALNLWARTALLQQEVQHSPVEVDGSLHVHHVSCSTNQHHGRSGDRRRKRVDDPPNDWAVAVTDEQQRGCPNRGQAAQRRRIRLSLKISL